jgi:hypothetical protein
MTMHFDPYHLWFGIPPYEQPANHYRLLGLGLFEANPALIAAAADQRIAALQTFQLGPEGGIAQRLMHELAIARMMLLDPRRKAAYDAVLRSAVPGVTPDVQMLPGMQQMPPAWQQPAFAQAPPAMAPAGGYAHPPSYAPPPAYHQPPAYSPPPGYGPPGYAAAAPPVAPPPVPQSVMPQPAASAFAPAKRSPAPSPGPAAPPAPPRPGAPGELGPGATIGKYRLIEQVSTSSLGRVYKAQHGETGRLYFLKCLPPESQKSFEVQKRFQREIEILTKLDHPHLIVGRESGVYAGQPYLVMEYVMGADLATLVKQHGPLSPDDAAHYTIQAAQALAELHKHGIVHRNLKPHVLLVDLQGNVRLTNLLLAKVGEQSSLDVGDDQLTMQGEQMGSVDYLPPEQALDARQADARSDLYALGCTLFFVLTGHPPYVSKRPLEKILAHRSAPIPSLREIRADVPAALDQVCRKLLAKNPQDRFQTAEELIATLDPDAAEAPALSWWSRLFGKK